MIGENELFTRLTGPVASQGYELVSLRYSKNKDGWTLNVVVDRPEPISLDDIVGLSDYLSATLDEIDPIEGGYLLDISSLGAEKPIALDRRPLYKGRYVNLHLSHPYQGENILEGTLLEIDDESLVLQIAIKAKKKSITLPRADVDKARLAIEF